METLFSYRTLQRDGICQCYFLPPTGLLLVYPEKKTPHRSGRCCSNDRTLSWSGRLPCIPPCNKGYPEHNEYLINKKSVLCNDFHSYFPFLFDGQIESLSNVDRTSLFRGQSLTSGIFSGKQPRILWDSQPATSQASHFNLQFFRQSCS